MSETVKTILHAASQLSERDRGEVVAHLLEHLDSPAESDVGDSWSAEILGRLEDVRSGRSAPVPWKEARRQILEDGDDGTR